MGPFEPVNRNTARKGFKCYVLVFSHTSKDVQLYWKVKHALSLVENESIPTSAILLLCLNCKSPVFLNLYSEIISLV